MERALREAVERTIEGATGKPARVRRSGGVGGGCINRATAVTLEDGRRFFLKSNPSPLPRMFECEAAGLRALGEAGAIRVPAVIGTGGREDGTVPFILLEHIEPGAPKRGYFEEFGHRFAELHRSTQRDRFGFDHDNYIGSTPQPNGWKDDWVDFWRERRLGFQLDLARENGLSDRSLDRLGERLMQRLDELIGEPEEPACLLHGDLWGGNHMADENGSAVLIDPAVYRGRREADLAMTMLFGGFDRAFYTAYEEAWPLADGSEVRLEVYKLYHLLNHLNLFGTGYKGGCLAILQRLT